MSVIVAVHDEESVVRHRVENLLEQDYPEGRLEVVVASDGSTDRTDAIVEELAAEDSRVRLVRCPRAGKFAALDVASRETSSEVIAFSDANTRWASDALSTLVHNFADPEVGYVCGRLRLEEADGTNREGIYWRYELWLRACESDLGSITCGNGAIYAVRRGDYVEGCYGHDLGLPHLVAKSGRRAVYEPEALAFEKPSRDLEDEYRRKVRMLRQAWCNVVEGGLLRGGDPVYRLELVSHRLLRYGSGVLHLIVLPTSIVLARRGATYRLALSAQVAWLALAAAGRSGVRVPGAALAYYYLLVTWATVDALVRYLRAGSPATWAKAPGTR